MTRARRRRRGNAETARDDGQGAASTNVERPIKAMGEVKPVSGYETWLKFGLYGFCLACVATIVSSLSAIVFFTEVQNGAFADGLRDAEAEGTRIDQIAILVGVMWLITYLSSVVAYGFFFSRSLKNLQAVHEADPEMKPYGTWAWYLVPFANLWKPLEGFSEVRNGSRHAEGKPTDSSGSVGLWWFSWIALNIVSNISGRLLDSGLESGNIDTLKLASMLDVGAAIAGLVAAFLLARFVAEIGRGQEQVQFMSNASAFD